MKPFEDMEFHPIVEKLTNFLMEKIRNNNPEFFRLSVNYQLSKLPSMMRVNINSAERGILPINMYAINLAPSGQGKGYSTNIFEDHITKEFKRVFKEETLPIIEEENLARLAIKRAVIKDVEEDTMLEAVKKEYKDLGEIAFTFDSATPEGIKQFRQKLMMGEVGSINFEVDEIGSNLLKNVEALNVFLELFDVGKIKQKLTKNTKENTRSEEIEGKTPANFMGYGEPFTLFDGGKTEAEVIAMLQRGYARRCFFGYTVNSVNNFNISPEDEYDLLTDASKTQFLEELATQFGELAQYANYGRTINIPRDVGILLIEYRQHCEKLAAQMSEYQHIAKTELKHRYFKAMKLAGVYAFIDGNSEMTEDNLYAAIKMVETSGSALDRILNREGNYAKLAKYIAGIGKEVTQVDLMEQLTFYKGAVAIRTDLMNMAIAWGYKNQIIIKKSFVSGVEFLSGETLKETDLNKMILSVSKDIANGYQSPEVVPFDKLINMTQKDNLHWINHKLTDGHRHEESIIKGFNMIVLDVDDGTPLESAKILLKDYKCLFYTTKRHTEQHNRFRIIMPTNYVLKLNKDDYKDFMNNIFEWIPFEVDAQTNQRARKWLTHNGEYYYSKGEKLIDVMEFIPRTSKNDERQKQITNLQSLTNLERWFITNTGNGNRSNQLVKYGLLLVDAGHDFDTIRTAILDLNSKLIDKLDENEITATILTTVSKALAKKQQP